MDLSRPRCRLWRELVLLGKRAEPTGQGSVRGEGDRAGTRTFVSSHTWAYLTHRHTHSLYSHMHTHRMFIPIHPQEWWTWTPSCACWKSLPWVPNLPWSPPLPLQLDSFPTSHFLLGPSESLWQGQLSCLTGHPVSCPQTPPVSTPGGLEQGISGVFASSMESRLRVHRQEISMS